MPSPWLPCVTRPLVLFVYRYSLHLTGQQSSYFDRAQTGQLGRPRLDGVTAARRLHTVCDNVARILAVEVLCAVQGVEHRQPLEPAAGTGSVARAVREIVPQLKEDRPIGSEIEAVASLIERDPVPVACEAVGLLN